MSRLKPWHKTALVGLAYALLVGMMTWPAISALGERLIGDNEDAWIFFWNNWWFKEALTTGSNLFETSYLFFPGGTSLVAHSSSFISSFLALLLEPLAGPVVAYNLVFLLGLWIGAMGMYLLANDITHHKPASFLAGFVFAFAPYHISQALDHAHLGSIHWWPFFILFFRRGLMRGGWRNAVAAGVFAALTIWSGLQIAVFLALWGLLYFLWFAWNQRFKLSGDREYRVHIVGHLGVILLTALLLSLPLLYTLLSNWSEVSGSSALVDESVHKQTDLLSYVVPPPYNSLWGDQVDPVYDRFPYHRGFKPFIGFSVIVLAVAAAWGWRKKAGFWLLSAGLWILLAAGPALRFNGSLYEWLPLPYKWLGTIFPISTVRAPDRFNLLLVLSMAVLAGMGAAYLARHRTGRWILIPITLFLFLEFLFIPIPSLRIPERSLWFSDTTETEGNEAIVDYPMSYTLAKQWLYFQTIHGKPTVDGHVSRYTSETYDFLASQPLLNALYDGGEVPRYLPAGYFEDRREASIIALGPAIRDLRENGVRFLLVHLPFASEERIDHLKSILPLAPAYQDDLLIAYDLVQPRLYSFDPYPISISPEIDIVQFITKMSGDLDAMDISFLAQMTSPQAEDVECTVVLGDEYKAMPFTAFPTDVEWKNGDLARVNLEMPIPEEIPDGRYRLRFGCPGLASTASLDNLLIDGENRSLFTESLQLTFDDLIQLEGYRQWFEAGDLHLELQWLALSEIGQDFKVFIHLINDAGNIVRQGDFIHCMGECPTGQWEPGQQVSDESYLSLSGLPEGEYRLAVGLYNGETGQRLETRDRFGQLVPDAYSILDSTIKINENRSIWEK